MSPMAKMPGVVLSNFPVSTAIRFSVRFSPNLAMGPQFDGEAEERDEGVAGMLPFALVGACERHRAQLTRPHHAAPSRWRPSKLILPCAASSRIWLTLCCAARKPSRVMDEGELGCDRRQVDRPIERAVAASGDEDVLAAKRLHLAHGIVARTCLHRPRWPAMGGRLGTKLPPPAAITSTGAMISVSASVESFQRPSGSFSSALAHLAEVEGRRERLDLFEQGGRSAPGPVTMGSPGMS